MICTSDLLPRRLRPFLDLFDAIVSVEEVMSFTSAESYHAFACSALSKPMITYRLIAGSAARRGVLLVRTRNCPPCFLTTSGPLSPMFALNAAGSLPPAAGLANRRVLLDGKPIGPSRFDKLLPARARDHTRTRSRKSSVR